VQQEGLQPAELQQPGEQLALQQQEEQPVLGELELLEEQLELLRQVLQEWLCLNQNQ
jgi:hypothetical protein